MKIGFVSLGCCKNLVDSEQIMGMIKRGGHEIVAILRMHQAIIVNTCGFIESSKEESINAIFKMAQYKERKLREVDCVWLFGSKIYRDFKGRDS